MRDRARKEAFLHNPIEDVLHIESSIILREGNYLLLDADGWRDLSSFADYTISVRAEETLLRTRLIDRRIKTGVEKEAATRFVDFSDMPNVRLCLEKTMRADLELQIGEDGNTGSFCFMRRQYKEEPGSWNS